MVDFHLLIADWYRQNKRSLPWRDTENPYFIWLSEIILQQTRVNQGMEYYTKFISNYPTIFDLANASEQKVLADWQGLGYYSRARNLHFASKYVVETFNGIFPSDFQSIKKMKGVGDYTAAAIASFAFNLPHAVVDGNVFRVLSRVFDVEIPIDSSEGKKFFDQLAQQLLGENPPALHNQAIMEFGALQCVPSNPDCTVCPLSTSCLARQNNTILSRPVKKGKIKIRKRYFHFLMFDNSNAIVLEKRVEKDIWQHLYQFPLIETENEVDEAAFNSSLIERFGIAPVRVSESIKHILSHQHIYAKVWHFDAIPIIDTPEWIRVPKNEISDYPIPRLLDRYLENEV